MACTKKNYPDKRAAQTAINARLKSHSGNRPDFLRLYDCPDCNGWHIAHGKAANDKFHRRAPGPRYHRPPPGSLIIPPLR